jgi:hypothetical protein
VPDSLDRDLRYLEMGQVDHGADQCGCTTIQSLRAAVRAC